MTDRKWKILFLCTGNSCRSQMAEGIVNHDFKRDFDAYSAGSIPTPITKYTIQVMREIGIDITEQYPKHVDSFINEDFDLVITLCDYAAKQYPNRLKKGDYSHIPFDDPFSVQGSDDEIIAVYRRVRDEMRKEIGLYLTDFLKQKILQSGELC